MCPQTIHNRESAVSCHRSYRGRQCKHRGCAGNPLPPHSLLALPHQSGGGGRAFVANRPQPCTLCICVELGGCTGRRSPKWYPLPPSICANDGGGANSSEDNSRGAVGAGPLFTHDRMTLLKALFVQSGRGGGGAHSLPIPRIRFLIPESPGPRGGGGNLSRNGGDHCCTDSAHGPCALSPCGFALQRCWFPSSAVFRGRKGCLWTCLPGCGAAYSSFTAVEIRDGLPHNSSINTTVVLRRWGPRPGAGVSRERRQTQNEPWEAHGR